MAEHRTTCRVCGKRLQYAGTGRYPVKCGACDPKRGHKPRKTETGHVPAAPTRGASRRAELKTAKRLARAAEESNAARRLAIALRLEKRPEQAAKLAGLACSDTELAELVAEAASEAMAGLREGQQSETAAILSTFITMGALRLLEGVHTLPYGSIPAAIKAATQALEMLGGGKLSYANVTYSFGSAPVPA